MLSTTDQKIAKILAVSTAEAAALAVGVSPSYVSQLTHSEEFQQLVAAHKAVATEDGSQRAEHNSRLDSMEYKAAKQLDTVLQMGMIYDPDKLLRIIERLNRLHRRADSTDSATPVTQHAVVTIEVGQGLAAKLQLSSRSEVMAVGDRQLQTISPERLAQDVYSTTVAAISSRKGDSAPARTVLSDKKIDFNNL